MGGEMSDYLCGAHIDPAATEAVCLELANDGREPLFADAKPELKGFGDGKSVFAGDSELKLFGKQLPPWLQTRGTCVSMGVGRALQDAAWYAIAFGDSIGKPVELSSETIYGGARVTIGKGSLGKASPWGTPARQIHGDGAIPDHAALFVYRHGLLERGVYGSVDLSHFREELSILWGNNGVPATLLQESATHKAEACFRAMSVEDVRDGIAAGYFGARSAPKKTEGVRDADGMVTPRECGGHCQELSGVYVDRHGDLCFEETQSWGTMGPHGGGTYKLKDGREVTPRPGAGGIRADDVRGYLRAGPIWLFAPPVTLWHASEVRASDL
jgi:hypothetical protein